MTPFDIIGQAGNINLVTPFIIGGKELNKTEDLHPCHSPPSKTTVILFETQWQDIHTYKDQLHTSPLSQFNPHHWTAWFHCSSTAGGHAQCIVWRCGRDHLLLWCTSSSCSSCDFLEVEEVLSTNPQTKLKWGPLHGETRRRYKPSLLLCLCNPLPTEGTHDVYSVFQSQHNRQGAL